MKVSIIVPSYLRLPSLKKCLNSLFNQTQKPFEIIVIIRDTDKMAFNYLKKLITVKLCVVSSPGQINALNAGLKLASGDIVAFTDDDAIPEKDWIKKINLAFLSNEKMGAVGGRDIISENEILKKKVGLISFFGRVIGNHHAGFGEQREVDFLKGVNMAFRKKAVENILFNNHFKGNGAQLFNDSDFCLEIKKKGWKIIYDPQIIVKHLVENRVGIQREDFDNEKLVELAYNQTFSLLNYFGKIRGFLFLLNSFIFGTKKLPGLFYFPFRFIFSKNAFPSFKSNFIGRFAALKDRITL